MKIEAIELLTKKYFDGQEIIFDIEIVSLHCNKYELDQSLLEDYYKSIYSNLSFFKKELNYSLQISNILLFEIDARSEKMDNFRGSSYRAKLILKYREILKK